MDIIEIIAWLVVFIVGIGIVGVYLPRSPKLTPVETELQKLRKPSPEAVAKVKARDEELARTRNADTKKSKHEPQSYEKGAYWKNQPLSPKRFN